MRNNELLDKIIFALIALFVIFLPFCELINYSCQAAFVNALFIILLILSLYKNEALCGFAERNTERLKTYPYSEGRGFWPRMYKFNLKLYFLDRSVFFFWLYLFLISLNIWFAQDRKAAADFYAYFISTAILIYFTIKNSINGSILSKILYIYFICAGIISLFGLWEILTSANFIYKYFIDNYYYSRFIFGRRIMSTFIHPNILGAYLVSSVPLGLYFCKNAKSKIFDYLLFASIIFVLILTYSRGTWFAFLLILSIWFILNRKMKWVFILWGAFFVFCLISSTSFMGREVRVRFDFSYLWNYIRHGHRTMAYFVTFDMLKSHPFAGIGLNSYRELFSQYTNMILPYEVMIPDSIYLMHLAETGLTGFAGLIMFLFITIRQALLRCKQLPAEKKDIYIAVILSFSALLFNMAFFDGFLWRSSFYLFWIFISLAAFIGRAPENF